MKAGKIKALKSSEMKRNRINEYNGNFFWGFLHSINQKIVLNRISIKMPFLSGWYFRRFTIISGCRGCAEKVIYLPTDRIVGIRRQYNEEKIDKKYTNQTIEAYELWIYGSLIDRLKNFRKNNKYFIKLQIDKRKRIYLKRGLET